MDDLDDERFFQATGYFPEGASHRLIENEHGFATVDKSDFQTHAFHLAAMILDGSYSSAHLEQMDPVIRPLVVEAGLRAVLHMALLSDDLDAGVKRSLAMVRMQNVVTDYRKLVSGG